MSSKAKRWFQVSGLLLALYAGVYVCNSSRGGYWGMEIGETRYAESGVGVPSLCLWQPRYGYCAPSRATFLGWVFAPAIAIDRAWVHRNLDLFEPSDQEDLFSKSTRWHPVCLAEEEAKSIRRKAYEEELRRKTLTNAPGR